MEKVVLPNEVLLDEVAQLLNEGRDVVMTPKGNSMFPFIRGEVDRVRLQKPTGLQVGDIVLACFGGCYVLHRLIAMDGERITLMGDGNLQGSESGLRSEVVGKVTEIITPSGHQRRPSRGRLWRKLLPVRKYLLKLHRKWNKWFGKQQNNN